MSMAESMGTRPAKIWVAVVLVLLMPGAAYLYAGASLTGALVFAALTSALSLAVPTISTQILPWDGSLVLTLVASLLLLIAMLVAVVVKARSTKPTRTPGSLGQYVSVVGLSALFALMSVGIEYLPGSTTFKTFNVPTESMTPTILPGDRLRVNLQAYTLGLPHRGDLIAFRYPKDPDVTYIKRVAGVPGDTVVTAKGETVSVDEDSIFAIGDNAANSSDSRHYGAIPADHIVGKVEGVMFSLGPTGLRWNRTLLTLR